MQTFLITLLAGFIPCSFGLGTCHFCGIIRIHISAVRDPVVLASGTCGFGMGATPNAMANMQVLCEKYAPSVKAYLIIPLIGSLFADFINSLVITFFINIL